MEILLVLFLWIRFSWEWMGSWENVIIIIFWKDYLGVAIIKPKLILKSLSKEGEAGMKPFVL